MPLLTGVTWKHDRGLSPMVATAASFSATHPDVTIEWEARGLKEFGDSPVDVLAKHYDLVVIDHPFIGQVAEQGCFLPLEDYIGEAQLQILATSSVGQSHQSYHIAGRQWALAIDGACQVSGFRPDLLERAGVAAPQTWEGVMELSKIRRGFVSVPLCPVDALICFFTLCANAGEAPFDSLSGHIVSKDVGEYALLRLRDLARNSIVGSLSANPVGIWEKMSTTDEIAYCPLGFGYSNYARSGYRRTLVSFGAIPSVGEAGPTGSTLGGAGLAISKRCAHPDSAGAYALWVASGECQRTIYVRSGGQPANRAAWIDADANTLTNGFFANTLPNIEAAWMRPRFSGFTDFQDNSATVIAGFLCNEQSVHGTLDLLDKIYHEPRA